MAKTTTKKTGIIDKVRSIGRKQAVGVRGTLLCGENAVKNGTVKLWDNDMLDPDDLMAEISVSEDGSFEISGYAVSITNLDPQLRIYHHCLTSGCRRKVKFTVPKSYINDGKNVTKWFNIGTINMEIGFKNKESSHCIE
ncbi:unnamed protein product [Caenorhabditis angaria]|uniref:Uncharacterized protein n=1 Tax=Caenorhabditis angaria TaxID=860376 RepID=A0A9P1IS58_9PELO|nr:unnamed protein product [Caenorhabditis angaria]